MVTAKKERLRRVIKLLAVFMAGYHLYSIAAGRTEPYFYRFTHLTLASALGALLYISRKENKSSQVYGWLLGAGLAIVYLYFYFNYERIVYFVPGMDMSETLDILVGIILIVLVLELTRIYVSWVLSFVCVLFLGYALAGSLMPGVFYHGGLSFSYMVEELVFSLSGVFGSALAVSSHYIIVFLVFGSFLTVSGVGEYFIELATALAGGARGGPAKVAVIASAFIGSVIGGATSNVTITGAFTIPLMKKHGFKTDFSAAVEVASSASGSILPPVMGAVAFVMAEILGISYLEIVKASLIPAVLYLLGVLVMVDIYAVKNNLRGLSSQERPSLPMAMRRVYKLLPLIIIVVFIFAGYSPIFSGFAGILSTLILGLFNNGKRLSVTGIIGALEKASTTAVQIILACAVSGLITGSIASTGLSGKFSSILIQYSGGIAILILIFVMISTIVLGMGMPITPAYLTAAALGVPVLASLGFAPIAAHLFVLYFAAFAPLTPPVAITSYVAAGMAGGSMGRTSLQALLLASIGFIIPFMFIFHNELLMIGGSMDIFVSTAVAIFGIVCFAGGVQGVLIRPLNIRERITVTASGLFIVAPGFGSDLAGMLCLSIVLFSLPGRGLRLIAGWVYPKPN